ncbi:hypothetical protein Smar_1445 [Staphylothermus marinus F1]|uniref:Uncharacterized protein n=1 Tax=Staphylothermus marinus (strain ATCC 43588 / DSM 3639 / JCM 9404 / F1) TaxID=399550 RepID=A3DPH5_STAMF|nr:hypothetical protein [Staphylothermus marinus]ABN70535.1 hypothetical protein Smar_1445 [Staphylothermus marinus F1]
MIFISNVEDVKLLRCAIEEYIRKTGGHIIVEDHTVEIFLPVVIDEVPGGVQFKIKGRIEDDYVVIEQCTITVENEFHDIKPIDLTNWTNYVNENFSYACKSSS